MKTFLSIGTGPGIGIATAERFAAEGFRIVVSARNLDRSEQLAAKLRSKGVEVHVRAVDATDLKAVASLVATLFDEFGAIDVVHYNAANLSRSKLEDQATETFNTDLAVNIGGAMATLKTAGKAMKACGAGTVLLTGGGFALHPNPDYISISIGKAGIRALAQGVFEEYKAHGIHVATVTVAGFVSADTKQTAEIADQFWNLHAQPAGEWSVETIYEP